MSTGPRRARSEPDKLRRRDDLLTAAEEIALKHGVRDVTLTAVTSQVGLHPSAVRRYFESREELLLELTERGWLRWRAVLSEELGDRGELSPPEVADLISRSLERLPVFCDLLIHTAISLEGAVRLERARAYKTASFEAYDAICQMLSNAVTGLDEDAARAIAVVAMSSGAYLRQLSRPTETLAELYRQEPRWAHAALSFRSQLTELLTLTIRGALPTPDCGIDSPLR